jgi:hypothetical protein
MAVSMSPPLSTFFQIVIIVSFSLLSSVLPRLADSVDVSVSFVLRRRLEGPWSLVVGRPAVPAVERRRDASASCIESSDMVC